MHVLGHREHRRARRAQQFQHRQPHHRKGRSRATGHPQRRQQSITLVRWQPGSPSQHRPQQLVQPGERQARLALGARAGQHPHPTISRLPDRCLRQRGLPDPWIAEHQQRPAAAGDTGQQRPHHRKLRVAPDQHRSRNRPAGASIHARILGDQIPS